MSNITKNTVLHQICQFKKSIFQFAHLPFADIMTTDALEQILIPALCGKLTDTTVTQSLRQTSQADINVWEKKHISYTVRKKRHAFFNDSGSQNTGNYKTA